LPYADGLVKNWHSESDEIGDPRIIKALSLYAKSKNTSLTKFNRFSAIFSAYLLLKEVCVSAPAFLRLFSLARVANELGAREESLLALNRLLNAIQLDGEYALGLNEPFMAPLGYFDYVPIKPNDENNWVLAAMLEGMEKLKYHSSRYADVNDMSIRLSIIRSLGYGSEEMYRRMRLVEKMHNVTI
jgi:hypothetical protein